MAEVTQSASVAAAALAAGQLVALPTETVYGLGASIDHAKAVERVFQVKNRPNEHPLIVHVEADADLSHWATRVPATATALVEAFWPGPLTLVIPKSDNVPGSVTGGQNTVALRSPDSPHFLEVLAELSRLTGAPAAIAAPSANLFGQVSPTTAEHVQDGLGSRLDPSDIILDGGPSEVGIESTIVLCRDQDVEVLRPGGITEEDLAQIVTVTPSVHESVTSSDAQPRVSGSLESHYSPAAQVIVLEPEESIDDLATSQEVDLESLGIIALESETVKLGGATELARPNNSEAYAAQLYAALRKADDLGLRTVVAVTPPNVGIGVAIRDRLKRAAS